MLLEVISDMLTSSSPLYMYVGVLWSMVGAIQLINMNMDRFRNHHSFYVRQAYKFQEKSALIQEPIVIHKDIKSWLMLKMKLIDAPDDDSDADAFSLFTQTKEIRGGRHWKNHLYSHSLKNIAV